MYASTDIEALSREIYAESAFVDKILDAGGRVIVGQSHMMSRLMLGLLADGHVLLEGLPGLAKTLSIKTLASCIDASFHRIQFTPDLLPADILGTMIYNPATSQFSVKQGPIFAQFILADEINRAPAKVQSALLEAMQERQVTIGGETFKLQEPFLVLATQNPIEQEGTYNLPEAQVDRFMFKVTIGYPNREEERMIMQRSLTGETSLRLDPVVTPADILRARQVVRRVYLDEKIENYILDIVFATREPEHFGLGRLRPLIAYGASPRASINLMIAARAMAFMNRRGYVIPEDVRQVCPDVLRHRIGLSYEAEAESINQDELIRQLLHHIPVP
jgi:MoxR-like ATPase